MGLSMGLNVTRAAEILGSAPGDAFGPSERQRFAIAGDGASYGESLFRKHGHVAADAGLV